MILQKLPVFAKDQAVKKIFISHPGGGWFDFGDDTDAYEKWIISVLFADSFPRWFDFITHDDDDSEPNEDNNTKQEQVVFFDTIDDAFQALKMALSGLDQYRTKIPVIEIPELGNFPWEIWAMPF